MRLLCAAALLALPALLVGPAHAQAPTLNLLQDQPSKTPDEIEADKEKDKAYKESLKKIPDAKASSDPWGSVRSDAPKSAPAKTNSARNATASKARTKTGSNAQN